MPDDVDFIACVCCIDSDDGFHFVLIILVIVSGLWDRGLDCSNEIIRLGGDSFCSP